MKKKISPAVVTLWANRAVALVVFALLFTLPLLMDAYAKVRTLLPKERGAVMAAFYICAGITLCALWQMDGLLRCILKGQVFVRENVKKIRRVQYCCGGVSLVCLPAAAYSYPLIFVVVIMAFLCLAVSVVHQVMGAAVAIREENDLTI